MKRRGGGLVPGKRRRGAGAACRACDLGGGRQDRRAVRYRAHRDAQRGGGHSVPRAGARQGRDGPAPGDRAFTGSAVFSYAWPTSLDSASVGFDAAQGILALAVTFHPDFDDAAGGATNRHVWHPHWVVLTPDEACGKGALKVKDIPAGTTPRLPATWPNVPLLIDSPTYPTALGRDMVEVRVPAGVIGATEGMRFDGVTSALKVNANLHAPLLCISDVFDIASGDLSLPGRLTGGAK